MAIDFTITTDGKPQTSGTRWRATRIGAAEPGFLVGQTVPYSDADGPHRGLYQTRVLGEIPQLHYDRHAASAEQGLWAHFIWPTVVAESGGHHLLFNSYDRARFTWGFYQLAAHTPNDNLILLFRELLALPKAAEYFPDLRLHNGKVQRVLPDGSTKSLEVVTSVTRPNGKVEDQLVGFMSYLNPDTSTAGDTEARNAARLMHWLQNDPAAISASVRTALAIMKRKIRSAATTFGLKGKDPRLAIWVSDIRHQGRGGTDVIKAALKQPTLAGQLDALSKIGASANSGYASRCKTVKARIADLTSENAFGAAKLGDAGLAL